MFEMDRREFAKGAAGSALALALAFAPLRRAAADFGKISES